MLGGVGLKWFRNFIRFREVDDGVWLVVFRVLSSTVARLGLRHAHVPVFDFLLER